MSGEFDLYVRRNTWLHRLDPRVKLVFVVEGTLLTFLWPTVLTALGLSVLCIFLMWRAQVPLRSILRIGRVMLPLVAVVFLLTALFGGGSDPALISLWLLRLTAESLGQAAVLVTRLLALALLAFLWLFTTDQASMVRGFVALRMPYEWGLTLALALRYLPIFAGLFEQVRDAQQARGLDLEGGGFWSRLAAYRPVLVAMVISALRNSEHLGWALEARGLGAAGVRRSVFRPLHLRRADILTLVGLGLVAAVAIALRVL